MIPSFKKICLKALVTAVTIITVIGFSRLTNAKQAFAINSTDSEILQTQQVFIPKTKEDTVNLWAEALKERNGAFRYAILSNDLKRTEYEKYNEMNWVIGVSSPWVVNYQINKKNKIDDKTYKYEIQYTMTDSTKTLYTSYENIVVTQLGNQWVVINHDNYDYLPEIAENTN